MRCRARRGPGTNVTTLAVAPRVGFLVPTSDTLSIWPRAGFSYVSIGTEQDFSTFGTEETTITLQNLVLEAMFAISPSRGVAILLGPVLDLGVGGSFEAKSSAASRLSPPPTSS